MSSLTGKILRNADDSGKINDANNSATLLNGGDTIEIKSD
jgi:hypothetical protein